MYKAYHHLLSLYIAPRLPRPEKKKKKHVFAKPCGTAQLASPAKLTTSVLGCAKAMELTRLRKQVTLQAAESWGLGDGVRTHQHMAVKSLVPYKTLNKLINPC